MRPFLVVVLTQRRYERPSMRETCEPVLVEAFIPELTVERLDICVLRRLALPNQFQRHAIGVGPLVERAARKFRFLVVRTALV